ncbi:MAG: 3'-5' exonuclease [Phototrophicales bacterium]|nr:MAG: DNA polymerase III [Phototrophicales bacterium]RMG77528.1 MAG: DNA polymerase III [Chloroflexota bacterium]
MKVVVVDIEATCWRKSPPPGEQNEIIEVGVCWLNLENYTPSHKRSLIVRPTRSKVSDYCTKLTTLTQEQVDKGMSFAEACAVLQRDYQTKSFPWVSWGNYDRKMFQAQCASFNVPYPFSEHHINLKDRHANLMNNGKRIGMTRALTQLGLELVGTHHRGHDDAWNIARILGVMLKQYGEKVF